MVGLVLLLLLIVVLTGLGTSELRVTDAGLILILLIVGGQLGDGILEVDVVVHVVDGWLVELGKQVRAFLELHG